MHTHTHTHARTHAHTHTHTHTFTYTHPHINYLKLVPVVLYLPLHLIVFGLTVFVYTLGCLEALDFSLVHTLTNRIYYELELCCCFLCTSIPFQPSKNLCNCQSLIIIINIMSVNSLSTLEKLILAELVATVLCFFLHELNSLVLP